MDVSKIPQGKLRPASSLAGLAWTLMPEPLQTQEEIAAFYRSEVAEARGTQKVAMLEVALTQSIGIGTFRCFLAGHPGVGKSTELTRLIGRIAPRLRAIRLNIADELNPAGFRVFDVVLLMMAVLFEEASRLRRLPAALMNDIKEYLASRETVETSRDEAEIGAEAGGGVSDNSLLAGLLGFFARAKAQIRYAVERSERVVAYETSRLSDLVGLMNRLAEEANRGLTESQEWLFVIEGFDKFGVTTEKLRDLFINYGTVFDELRVHMILTAPIWLLHSQDAERLPFGGNRRFVIPDIPVYTPENEPNIKGRMALTRVLESRAESGLFAEHQIERLVVACGGSIRDLFSMVSLAALNAQVDNRTLIEGGDVETAINEMRGTYLSKLGDNPGDPDHLPFAAKADRLKMIYEQQPEAKVPDVVLYSLLRSRSVLQFNGQVWYGVHPLVVDILKQQKKLESEAPGGSI